MREKILEFLADGVVVLDRSENTSPRPDPDALSMWTIYANPADYPGKWVVRRQEILPGLRCAQTGDMSVHDTLEAARKAIPNHTGYLGRQPEDEPQIVESWM
ncbi:MAG: hypothetical protein EOO77_25955 [Oxalobacteraceae bacterium]|nr:MAG: hypothetical protein EOO77_25955 [Oxalobacteraceae bacterium]